MNRRFYGRCILPYDPLYSVGHEYNEEKYTWRTDKYDGNNHIISKKFKHDVVSVQDWVEREQSRCETYF